VLAATIPPAKTMSTDLPRHEVIALYSRLLRAWNARSAESFASQFTDDGSVIGFDGSQLDGRAAIAAELGRIFADHRPATFVAKVREVRDLGSDVALLRAVVGMLPPDQSELRADRNAIQSLVAVLVDGAPKIALFQNTPARFDGRPPLTDQLTVELTVVLRSGRAIDAG
jgi:uncharacterized protein (TIGR02246 family)